jgi:hypothetical protein
MKNRPIALSLVLPLGVLGATVFMPSALAQRGGSASAGRGFGAPAGRGGAMAARGGIRAGAVRAHPRGTGRYRAGPGYGGYGYLPLLGDYADYGPDYDTELAPEVFPQQMAGVQTAPAASPAPPPARPAEALVLERQGDHWVRITPYGPPQTVSQTVTQASDQATAPQPERASSAAPAPSRGQAAAATPPAPPPPAVLVFRDGHQEQIGQYRIMGANIYLNTDYWSSGAWTRTIPIADLDVPATLKLNQQRGANFRLPSGPNEVMIGG